MKVFLILTVQKGALRTDATLVHEGGTHGTPNDGDEYRFKMAKIAKERCTIFIATLF